MTETPALIEVLNIEKIEKGTLLAQCDVRIVPWKMTLIGVKIFEKGANRWVNLPSSKEVLADNTVKYTELVAFDSDFIKRKFRDQVMAAIDKHIAENPEMKSEPVITDGGDLPF